MARLAFGPQALTNDNSFPCRTCNKRQRFTEYGVKKNGRRGTVCWACRKSVAGLREHPHKAWLKQEIGL